jgi:hypothetical protein
VNKSTPEKSGKSNLDAGDSIFDDKSSFIFMIALLLARARVISGLFIRSFSY